MKVITPDTLMEMDAIAVMGTRIVRGQIDRSLFSAFLHLHEYAHMYSLFYSRQTSVTECRNLPATLKTNFGSLPRSRCGSVGVALLNRVLKALSAPVAKERRLQP